MIVSAYGFEDVVSLPGHRLDVSRIAAQVVSGIGFIGAGTIIFQKSENIVRGLTTAAGVWVVAAIGLACGGGMYVLATAATVLVLAGLEAFNYLLHKLDRRLIYKFIYTETKTYKLHDKKTTIRMSSGNAIVGTGSESGDS